MAVRKFSESENDENNIFDYIFITVMNLIIPYLVGVIIVLKKSFIYFTDSNKNF